MGDTTTHLAIPLILPSQAQKHVTHNEALLALDAIVHLTIDDSLKAPPADAAEGARYEVTEPAEGMWTGHEGRIAALQDGAWWFLLPKTGWLAWFRSDNAVKVYDEDSWHDLPAPSPSPDGQLRSLGINASADAVNRLAVAAQATLLNHAGNGHQLKINKAAAAETASLLFQSDWTGHAEMGLAGDNSFSIKVSDGANWRTGLSIRQSGAVSMPNRPSARAYRAAGSFSPAAGSQSGFTILDPVQGNVTLGLQPGGGGQRLHVPEDGLYLLSLMVTASASALHRTSLIRNGSDLLFTLTAPATATLTQSHCQLVQLFASDELSLRHDGTAELTLGPGMTELTLVML